MNEGDRLVLGDEDRMRSARVATALSRFFFAVSIVAFLFSMFALGHSLMMASLCSLAALVISLGFAGAVRVLHRAEAFIVVDALSISKCHRYVFANADCLLEFEWNDMTRAAFVKDSENEYLCLQRARDDPGTAWVIPRSDLGVMLESWSRLQSFVERVFPDAIAHESDWAEGCEARSLTWRYIAREFVDLPRKE